MRHGLSGNKFGRNQKLRQATVRDLAKALLTHESIQTTQAKALEARKLVEKLITKGKKNTLAAKRQAFAILCDHNLVSRLFNVVAPLFATRHGGYTRILKFALNRPGDNARMVLLELTEKSPVLSDARDVAAGSSKKAEDATLVESVPAEKKAKVVRAKPAASKKSDDKSEKKTVRVKKIDKKEK
jgi:large subunit ribosomal protein L17